MRRELLRGVASVAGGLPAMRPDQVTESSGAGVAPGTASGTFRGRQVIIFGTSPASGLFIYNGAPALGNPPQIAAVPSGVTIDPFGNPITSSKILMQANVITESAGVFRTAAAAPLIQLDGPHNAEWVYDAAANLIAVLASAAGNDGFGHAYPAGVTALVVIGGNTWAVNLGSQVTGLGAMLAGLSLQNQTAPFNSPPAVLGQGSTSAGAGLQLVSGKAAGAGQQSGINLLDSLFGAQAGGLAQYNAGQHTVNVGDGLSTVEALRVAYTTAAANPFVFLTAVASVAPGQLTTASVIWVDASGILRIKPANLIGDTNTYTAARRSVITVANTVTTGAPPIPIAGLSVPVGTGTYRIHGIIQINMGAAGPAAAVIGFTGPAISAAKLFWKVILNSPTANAQVNSAFATNSIAAWTTTGLAINTTYFAEFEGSFTCSAAGTLQAVLGEGTAGDHMTATIGSFMDLMPV
jgi:hypothetical protein